MKEKNDYKLLMDSGCKVVAFDFFDTLVHRKCHPEVIIAEWAREMSAFLDFKVDELKIYNLRKLSESELKKTVEESTYNELMTALYTKLNREYCLIVTSEEFVEYSANVEKEIELKNIYFNNDINPILDYANEKGKKIIIISDFYYGKELMEAVVNRIGISNYFSWIFVSADFGKRKSSGSIYDLVLERMGIEPSDMLMIGDNTNSDNRVPQSKGISTYHIEFEEDHDFFNEKQLSKKMKSILFPANLNAPFNGYLGTIFLFIETLYSDLVRDEVQEVLFCSREGQLLKKLFDLYQEKKTKKIRTHYFLVSRKSTLVAALDDIDRENFTGVFKQNDSIVLTDFLSSISFNAEEQETICKRLNLRNDSIVKPSQYNSCLSILKKDEFFRQNYDRKRFGQQQLFKKYINTMIKDAPINKLTVVDIGWKGSIQNNIVEALGNTVEVKGYYFGLLINDNALKTGLVFSGSDNKSKFHGIFSKDYMMYERIFVANHGPVNGYVLTDEEKVEPYMLNNPEELELYHYVREYQEQMITGFSELARIMNNSIYSKDGLKKIVARLTLYQNCVQYPKNWRIERDLRRKAKENFGDISGKLSKNKIEVIKKKTEKVNYAFVDYAYKVPQSIFKNNGLNFISKLYCYIVYGVRLLGTFGLRKDN